jgi:large subunit ribosomal protein L17
MPNHRKILI